MTTFHRLALGVLLLAGFAIGCTERNPLDAVVQPPTPINGTITVTTYNGGVVAKDVTITVTSFDGTSQTTVTAGTPGVGIILGQVIVPEPKAGNYAVAIYGQPATAPSSVKATLTVANPNANVSLQLSGGYLSITAAATGVTMYAETGGFLSFNVQYVNPSSYQQDIIVVPDFSGLPQGWSFVTQQAALKAGQTTAFVIQAPPLSVPGPTTLKLDGLLGSTVAFVATVTLQPTFSMTFTRNYSSSPIGAPCNNYYVQTQRTNFQFVVNGTNLTHPYPLILYIDGVPQGSAALTTTDGSSYSTIIWDSGNPCIPGYGTKTPFIEVYYGSQLLWSGTDPLGTYPYSYTN